MQKKRHCHSPGLIDLLPPEQYISSHITGILPHNYHVNLEATPSSDARPGEIQQFNRSDRHLPGQKSAASGHVSCAHVVDLVTHRLMDSSRRSRWKLWGCGLDLRGVTTCCLSMHHGHIWQSNTNGLEVSPVHHSDIYDSSLSHAEGERFES